MNQLDDMRILVEVIDRGSFSLAAQQLRLSKQLVSRRIMALEDRLGVQLLTRTTRRLSPTELGRDFAERGRRIIADVAEAELAMSSHVVVPRGTVRLSAPLSFGVARLSPMLADFMRLHPDVEIDLDLSDRAVDIIAEGFDMAIRIGVLPDSTLVARKLIALRLVICASPEYLRQRGVPMSPSDLKDHACLLFRHSRGVTWTLSSGGKAQALAVTGVYRANNGDVLADAAVAGLGIAQLPTFIVQPALEAGTLVTVLDDHAPPDGAAYAVYPSHRQRSTVVRALTDYLVAAFS